MLILKNLTLSLLVLFSAAAITSCNDKEDDNTIPTGNITALISFTPTSATDTCWVRYVPNGLSVDLVNINNNELLRHNSTGEKANLDYGQVPYGTYQIRVVGYVREGNICTTLSDQAQSKVDTTQVFTVDGPNRQVTFNITNKK